MSLRLSIIFPVFAATSFSLGAEEIRLTPGHRVMGRVLGEDADKTDVAAERLDLQRSDITGLKIGDAEAKGNEFFAKLGLKDGTQVFARVQKLPNGDVLIPKHPILGDNYHVTRDSVQSLTAAGEATITLKSMGDVKGYIIGEGGSAIQVEPAPGTVIALPRRLIVETPGKKEKPSKSPRATETMYIAATGGVGFVAGNLTSFIKTGYRVGIEYGYALPGIFSYLGSATVAGQFEKYAGDNLTIQYYRLYAGARRFFPLTESHRLFAKLAAGLSNERLTGAKTFSESVWVGGATLGWGYSYKLYSFAVFAENNFSYVYDSSNPLLAIGLELGVLYGF
ncbi:MAG: hypothetical protein KF713_08935 [Turneriella sp.]|nr:hypothetical protein [Turneriella sp.]